MLRRFWRFPALFAPSAILNSAGLVLPVLFVGTWYSVADAGQWAMAERILAAPLLLIATAISQVVEARMADDHRAARGGAARYYLEVSLVLALVATALIFLILAMAPWLLPIVLGDGWQLATAIVVAMTPMLATRLIATPLSKALVVAQRAFSTLLLDIARAILVVVAGMIIIAMDLDVIAAAWCFSGALSTVYVATWIVGLISVRSTGGASSTSTVRSQA